MTYRIRSEVMMNDIQDQVRGHLHLFCTYPIKVEISPELCTAHTWLETYIKEQACSILKFETEQIYVRACTYSVHKHYNYKTTCVLVYLQ